jgi:hypothetical protein
VKERQIRLHAILASDRELVAPDLFPIEIGNVLWKKVRAAELTAEQAVERFEGLGKMGPRLLQPVQFNPRRASARSRRAGRYPGPSATPADVCMVTLDQDHRVGFRSCAHLVFGIERLLVLAP